ncbi:MAG: alanine--glyoxylate aminotransferase family protein [Solirubrobacteraceae bacterium]
MTTAYAPLAPPERLLCGPGPANVNPAVTAALGKPLLGHLDPELHAMLLELVEMLGVLYGRRDGGLTLPLSGSGTSGMEAGIGALVDPGATVIVGVNGYFGARLAEIARRQGARVVEVAAPAGQAVPNADLLAALDAHPKARLLAVVHAETSTGVRHDLPELGAALAGRDTFLMADCVTSLGGIEVDLDAWGVDYAYSCTQKCLAAPPGMSPISLSARALEWVDSHPRPASFYLDLGLLRDYWVTRPAVYHHTLSAAYVYAVHEAVRLALAEGLPERWARHADAGAHLQAAVRERGLELLADPAHQLPQLTAIRVPEGVDGKAVQLRLLREHGIEIGGALAGVPPMWRIGLMGDNATRATADRVLAAFDAVLADERAPVTA